MPKNNRLSRAEIVSLKPLRREHGKFFICTLGKNLANKPKFACVVSKKVSPKAAVRNLIKRRVRAALVEIHPTSPIAVIVTAKNTAKEATYQEILSDLRGLIKKVS